MSKILNSLIDFARGINAKVDSLFAGAQKADVWFIIALAALSLGAAAVLKRRKIIVLALAVYVVTALYQALPFEWALKIGNNVWVFLGAVAVAYLILISSIARHFYKNSGGDYTGRIKTVLLAMITWGFLVSSALNFVTDMEILNQVELVSKLFSGDVSRAVWAALPLAGFLFLR